MKPYLYFLLLFLPTSIYSQSGNLAADESRPTRYIFFELGKTGLIYNLGYDQQLAGRKTGFRATVGSNFGRYLSLYNVGAGVYRLFGKKAKYFETGTDIYYLNVKEGSDDQRGIDIFSYPDYSTKTYYATINIGYRYSSGSRLFRVGVLPGISKDEFIPGGYISFGIGF